MRNGKNLLGLVAAGSLASLAGAQTPQLLVKDGSTIIGMGSLSTISNVQVLDSGTWITLIDTDFGDTGRDVALLRSGFVTLREGSPLFAPPGSSIDEFQALQMSPQGHLAMSLRAVLPGGAGDALYWNTVPVALRNDILVSPLVGANTKWVSFDVVKINANNEIFVIGDVDNPASPGQRDPTLCRYKVDGFGNVLETEVLLTDGRVVPVFLTALQDLPNTDHALAINDNGDYLTLVQCQGPVNGFLINGAIEIAREGAESPVPGRLWRTAGGLTNQPRLWINNKGEYLFSGGLEGSGGTYLMVKNGEQYVRSGEIYPTFSSAPLANATPAPLFLTNNGDVYWRADSTNNNDDAFMRNFTPIIQASRTVFQGDLVVGIEQAANAFSVSPNGRYFAGRIDLQLGGEAAVFVDFGLVEEIPGCAGNVPTLEVTDGLALPGNHLVFAMDQAQVAGALPLLFFSTRQSLPGSECGVNTAFGELLISNAHRVGRFTLPAWNGTASTVDLNVPPDPGLVNLTFYTQGLFRDLSGSSAPDFALTNGLRIVVGAP